MFCSFTLVLSVTCVQYPIWLCFCSSLISCFPVMLLRYCLSDLEIVPVAPIFTGITFAFIFPMGWISIMRYLNFKIFSASFLITFLSPGNATSINIHVPFLLSRIMVYSLLLGIVLSVRTFWIDNMVTLLSWLVSTCFGTWSHQCLLSNFTAVALHILKRSWANTLSYLFMHCSVASIGHADMMCSTIS